MSVNSYRRAAEKKLGRKLQKGEVVHHIDGNPSNNDPENLQIVTKSEHRRIHSMMKGRSKKKRVNVYIGEKEADFLMGYDELTLSEHIRRALDEYIDKLRQKKTSSSLSKRIGGEKDE